MLQLYRGVLQTKKVFCSECCRSLFTSSYLYISKGFGSSWRIKSGLPRDNTRYGPLTDLPDFSYVDGRPSPLSKGQFRRRQERIDTAKRVMQLLEEVDFAKENHKQRLQKQQKEKLKNINVLKPKS